MNNHTVGQQGQSWEAAAFLWRDSCSSFCHLLVVVQSLSCVHLFVTSWTAANQASLHYLPELVQMHIHWVNNATQLSHSLSPPSPAFNPMPSIRVFSNESALHIRWTKYWSFSFSISPSSEHSGLISFRIDWFDLLAVQRTLKSILQYQFKSVNSSVLSFLYSPSLTSIHDYWKNHRFAYTYICQQSDVSAFKYAI